MSQSIACIAPATVPSQSPNSPDISTNVPKCPIMSHTPASTPDPLLTPVEQSDYPHVPPASEQPPHPAPFRWTASQLKPYRANQKDSYDDEEAEQGSTLAGDWAVGIPSVLRRGRNRRPRRPAPL